MIIGHFKVNVNILPIQNKFSGHIWDRLLYVWTRIFFVLSRVENVQNIKGKMFDEKKYSLDKNLTYFLVESTFIFLPLAIEAFF